ncbi:protein-tyrosine phosphatase-like protein [Mycena floridula]|nr:protein-tyrosine phosphatase-like protein [Mycena floridula]
MASPSKNPLAGCSYNEIVPRIILGNLKSARSPTMISTKKVTHIVSVCPDFPSTGPNHFVVPVQDQEYEDLLVHFTATYNFIHTAVEKGGVVLIHCQMGISRSATVLAAYLMKARQTTAPEALEIIKQSRPQIQPNYGFLKQLDIYQDCHYEAPPSDSRVYASWRAKQRRSVSSFLAHMEDTTTILADQLYLCSELPKDPKALECLLAELGITHIVSVAPSTLQSVPGFVKRMHINVSNELDLLIALPECSRFIDQALDIEAGIVLVQSSRESRACVVAGAYLMHAQNMTRQSAKYMLEKALPLFTAPANFLRHLECLESCGPDASADQLKVAWQSPAKSTATSFPLPCKQTDASVSMSWLSETTGIDMSAFHAALASIQKADVIVGA